MYAQMPALYAHEILALFDIYFKKVAIFPFPIIASPAKMAVDRAFIFHIDVRCYKDTEINN